VKYVILIQSNADIVRMWATLDGDARAAAFQTYFDVEADLEASGELIESKALDERTQRIVRLGDDGPVVEGAPHPEHAEVVSGLYLVDVADEARAVEIAARFPEARYGAVRVARALTAEDFAAFEA
jgi:hypothetical protein